MKIWKVAVIGARGRMGSEAVKAVNLAQDMDLVAALGRGDSLETLIEAGAEVVIDLSVPEASYKNVSFAIEQGMHAVVGTTGWQEDQLTQLQEALAQRPGLGVLIAPNFALGSLLASRFAAQAAKFFESVEIIELHHPNKLDAPSGTASYTAQKIAQARAEAGLGASPDATVSDPDGARGAKVKGINVHAVRLRGLTAHQEVLLGDAGQQLTIRHDSFDRTSFMPGLLMGVRQVANYPGLTVGLENYLDLD